MPLSTEERTTILGWVGQLGPHQDASELLSFLRGRAQSALEELELQPGHDTVRAIVARALPALVNEAQMPERIAEARRAIQTYQDDLATGDPTAMLARQPAWAALVSLEVDRLEGVSDQDACMRAAQVARVGFLAADLPEEPSLGQIGWAIADQANEAGWSDRAGELWAWSLDQEFTDASHPSQVRLVLAFHRIETESPGAEELLDHVLEDPAAPPTVRNHARWVRAALHREAGATAAARSLLEEAVAQSEQEGEDPSITDQIRAALKDLDGPA